MSTPAPSLPAPAPPVNPETREFWDATAQGRLLVKQCQDCQALIWYPRAICPECSGTATSWVQASGRGTIYSWTLNNRGEGAYRGQPPFVLAYVQLEEGPRLMTNIVDTDGTDLTCGDAVEVVFADTGEGSALPRFRKSA